jgi:hypothetical protein
MFLGMEMKQNTSPLHRNARPGEGGADFVEGCGLRLKLLFL